MASVGRKNHHYSQAYLAPLSDMVKIADETEMDFQNWCLVLKKGVRNERYRLTRYFRQENPVIELYDHQQGSLGVQKYCRTTFGNSSPIDATLGKRKYRIL